MIWLLLSLAVASELSPYAQVDVGAEGLQATLGATSVLTRTTYVYTGVTWQDGLDPLGLGTGLGRPHAELGVVAEMGALHVLSLVGAGWDGWTRAPLLVGRLHAVIEVPPFPVLIENRLQIEASIGQRLDTENRSIFLVRWQPLALGAQVEPGWTRGEGARTPLGLRANLNVSTLTLGLFLGWDLAQGHATGRFTGVVPF